MNERELVGMLLSLQGNQKLAVQEFLHLFLEISSEGFSGESSFIIQWTQGQVGGFDYLERRKLLKTNKSRRVRGRGVTH